jgi:soluble lytic murein transglycosylase-like protein
MKAAMEQLQKEMGSDPLAVAVYNVGGGFVRKPFLELSAKDLEGGWESNGYAIQPLSSGALTRVMH